MEFDSTKKYYFIGSLELVEESNTILLNEKIYLGTFIEYIGTPYLSDWFYDGKAKFEFGTISKGYYDKIISL